MTNRITSAIPDTNLRSAVFRALSTLPAYPDTSIFDSLGTLSASFSAIQSLDGIAILRRLKILDLSANAISDITALAALQELECLDLSANRVVDLTSISGLSHLQLLVLDDNLIDRLDALTTLPRLMRVSLLHNPVDAGDTVLVQLTSRGVEVVLSTSPTTEQPTEIPGNNDTVRVGPTLLPIPLGNLGLRALVVGDDHVWYGAGLQQSGQFVSRSTDQGLTWQILADTALVTSGVGSPDVVSARGIDSLSLLLHSPTGWRVSRDLGRTWQLPRGLAETGSAGNYDPVVFDDVRWVFDSNTKAYALTTSSINLLVSRDSGRSWRIVRSVVNAFCLGPQPDEVVVGSGDRLWRTQDGGKTFAPLPSSPGNRFVVALAACPDSLSTLLVGTVMGLYRLDPGTGTWSTLLPASTGWRAMRLTVDHTKPAHLFVIAGSKQPGDPVLFDTLARELWYSSDAGQSWARIAIDDPREVVVDIDGTPLVVSDIGLYKLE